MMVEHPEQQQQSAAQKQQSVPPSLSQSPAAASTAAGRRKAVQQHNYGAPELVTVLDGTAPAVTYGSLCCTSVWGQHQ